MKRIFPAVFLSIWKRRETRIFLLFTLFPLIYFVASLFEGSNFMQITVADGYKVSYLAFLYMMIGSLDSLMLPTLTLYFLTIFVFRKELDSHILFLYKDLNRKQIFAAKFMSLISIISIYFILFVVITALVHYTRVAYLPFGTTSVFENDWGQTISTLFGVFTYYLQYLISISLATVACLYFSSGATMVIAVVVSIAMMLSPIIGGTVGLLFPSGYIGLSEAGIREAGLAFVGSCSITSIYLVVFTVLGSNKFKNMEF